MPPGEATLNALLERWFCVIVHDVLPSRVEVLVFRLRSAMRKLIGFLRGDLDITGAAPAIPCQSEYEWNHRDAELPCEVARVSSVCGDAIKERLDDSIMRGMHDRRRPDAAGLHSKPSQYHSGADDHRREAHQSVGR
jgi:hypothetical protein